MARGRRPARPSWHSARPPSISFTRLSVAHLRIPVATPPQRIPVRPSPCRATITDHTTGLSRPFQEESPPPRNSRRLVSMICQDPMPTVAPQSPPSPPPRTLLEAIRRRVREIGAAAASE